MTTKELLTWIEIEINNSEVQPLGWVDENIAIEHDKLLTEISQKIHYLKQEK